MGPTSMGLLSFTRLMLSCYERCHPGEGRGRGVAPFSHSFQERIWGGLWGCGSWLSLTPAVLYRTPRVVGEGGAVAMVACVQRIPPGAMASPRHILALCVYLLTMARAGKRCRCKFNQQQRTGEPDEEEGTFRSSIRRPP
ncbi:hypothetical protein A6R68_12652 [Neotoma lepida]|uniref:Uncharacterized protein n=1 Tax=Neotoma lepida TaxID=56216 RepID=A0A1A6H348_NEOLE|nr:hypothetical protein A6R68_12652 [Neotoma lepida]